MSLFALVIILYLIVLVGLLVLMAYAARRLIQARNRLRLYLAAVKHKRVCFEETTTEDQK